MLFELSLFLLCIHFFFFSSFSVHIDLHSFPTRRSSDLRLFSRRHVDQIRFIKRAQELGFTLSEIDDLLNLKMDEDTTCSEIKREAEQKYQDVIKKIEDLRRIKTTLTTLIDSCSGSGPKGDCPILEALEGDSKTGKELRK